MNRRFLRSVVRKLQGHKYTRAMTVALIALWVVVWGPAVGWHAQPLRPELAAAVAAGTAEPATIEAAAQVLDLRTFPVMEGATVSDMRGLGMLNYEVQAEAKAAFEFQQKQLQKLGWKELPGAYIDVTNASSKFTKEGFLVSVSASSTTGDPQKPGKSHVFLKNHGNIPTGKLPVPAGVKPFHPDVTQASYITEAKVADAATACRKLLLAAGWEPYGSAGSPESPMLYFKRNAVRLMLWVSTAPAAGGQTIIRYDTELLSADLPVPTDAPDPRYTDFQKTLRFDWPGETGEPVIEFYQERLPKQGWKATTERPVSDKKLTFLIFRNSQNDMLSLDLTKYTGIVRVQLTHQTAAEFAAQEQRVKAEQDRRRQELAKQDVKVKDTPNQPQIPAGVELPEMLDIGALLETLPKIAGDKPPKADRPAAKKVAELDMNEVAPAAGGPVKLAEIPVPADAKNVEYSKLTKMIRFTSPSAVQTLAKFYVDGLTGKGWSKSTPGLSTDQSAILKLAKGEAALTIMINRKAGGSEVTVMCKSVAWDAVPPRSNASQK